MRKSRQEAAATRQNIVEAASAEFRSKGIDGTSLADLMAAAGLTHGGFYKHFESKEQLVEESLALAADSMVESWKGTFAASSEKRGLDTAIAEYLSNDHRDDLPAGCPFAALGSEVAHGSDAVREATTKGFLKMIDTISGQLDGLSAVAAKKEALWLLSAMVGAVTMARVVTDPALSATILKQARKHLAMPS